jgi:hypothetical protein
LRNCDEHVNFSPQTRREMGSVSINNAAFRVEGEVGTTSRVTDCLFDGTFIQGTFEIGPGLPLPPPSAFVGRPPVITLERWVEVSFTDIGQPVLPFLQQAIHGVQAITAKLKTYL